MVLPTLRKLSQKWTGRKNGNAPRILGTGLWPVVFASVSPASPRARRHVREGHERNQQRRGVPNPADKMPDRDPPSTPAVHGSRTNVALRWLRSEEHTSELSH